MKSAHPSRVTVSTVARPNDDIPFATALVAADPAELAPDVML
jgi:hypothetical protein